MEKATHYQIVEKHIVVYLFEEVLSIQNLNIDTLSAVNPSQDAGGGGGGIGGGIFIDEAAVVVLENVTFTQCCAVGGHGGSGNGGGGGFMSQGVSNSVNNGGGGGGGLFGNGGDGAGKKVDLTDPTAPSPRGGGGGGALYAAYENPSSDKLTQKKDPGSGGDDFEGKNGGPPNTSGGNGGGGGGGGGEHLGGKGGHGGDALEFAGGGGGNVVVGGGPNPRAGNGGKGGFAGGGGGGGIDFFRSSDDGKGGNGGFAGGGGGAGDTHIFEGGSGGFAGGDASHTSNLAGGGAGLGGAIFIRKGGDLTIKTSTAFSDNVVQGGTGANPGQALGKDVFMMSGSQLTWDLSTDISIDSPIEGNQGRIDVDTPNDGSTTTKGLTKQGKRKLSLKGENTYTGTTKIEKGELNLNGSIVTDTIVEKGGILSGNLQIKQNIQKANRGDLTNHGMVSPGNKNRGKMDLTGHYYQSKDAILDVDITPTLEDSDKVFINDIQIATLEDDAILQVNIDPGNYVKGSVYTVINGPTTFNPEKIKIVKTGPLKDKVLIKIKQGSLILIIDNQVIFDGGGGGCALNQNAQAVEDGLLGLSILPNTELAKIIVALGVLEDCPTFNDTLNKMSAANYANIEWITLSTDTQISSILTNHIYSLKCQKTNACGTCKNTGIWINGIGDFYTQDPFDFLSGFDANTSGAVVGVDRCWQKMFFGIGGGYTYTDFTFKENSGFGHIHSGFGTIYGSFITKYFATDASVIMGGKHVDLHRKLAFLTINKTGLNSFDAPFVNTHLGLMLQGHMHDFRLEVFGNVDYHYLYLSHMYEMNPPLSLQIFKHHSHFLKGELGMLLKGVFTSQATCYIPFVGISAIKKMPLGITNYSAKFDNSTFCMDIFTSNKIQTLVSPKCGLRIHSRSFIFTISYEGEFNACTNEHQVEGRFEWIF
ncbi:MAG: hypothetical protein K940chlam8_00781 [Chlamydiae bacterium]|nr:hypothetical protein [Chlamydiota bacterium]